MMNASRLFATFLFSAAVGNLGVAHAETKTVTSNFVSAKECKVGMFGVVLTFDNVATVDASGKYIWPKGSAPVLMACDAMKTVQDCTSKRGVFQIKTDGGIYTPPIAHAFQCLQ
jgi:hypothetical protein